FVCPFEDLGVSLHPVSKPNRRMLMKNLVKLALVAVTAGGLTVGFACDKEGATAEKAGCNHGAKAETASNKEAGCNHEGAKVEKAGYKDEAGGCPYHSK